MYTNQTAGELDLERCTSIGIYEALISPIMKFNIIFTIFIIFLTFWYSYNALKVLKFHNIYSNCTRTLLVFTLGIANLWQATYLVIRIRNLYKVIRFSDNPCMIEFHSSECTIEQPLSAFCSTLSTFCVFSLTCDRIFALFYTKFYANFQNLLSTSMIIASLVVTFLIQFWTYYGIPTAGYVPTCLYPPQLALANYDTVISMKFFFFIFNLLLNFGILAMSMMKEKRTRLYNFNTADRYSSFENLETTKAICSISSTQFFFLALTSVSIQIIRYEINIGYLTEKINHLIFPFILAILYGNLSIPVLICYQTGKCIRKRKERIEMMTRCMEDIDIHMKNLQKMWS